ncbi:hypothetical protein NL108_011649 [Boleophthalmus pectinirostris]|nr:hypothetical protein NL108_011649 [Boleophthalmus pectinirostris]
MQKPQHKHHNTNAKATHKCHNTNAKAQHKCKKPQHKCKSHNKCHKQTTTQKPNTTTQMPHKQMQTHKHNTNAQHKCKSHNTNATTQTQMPQHKCKSHNTNATTQIQTPQYKHQHKCKCHNKPKKATTEVTAEVTLLSDGPSDGQTVTSILTTKQSHSCSSTFPFHFPLDPLTLCLVRRKIESRGLFRCGFLLCCGVCVCYEPSQLPYRRRSFLG